MPAEKNSIGGEVIIKHIRDDKDLRHESVIDKNREASGCIPLEGDPRLNKSNKEVTDGT